jgi:uncharacterized C2H2 Zn-finger protein
MDWTDPEQKRIYYRNYARKRRGGLKKHPYLLDDGSRYLSTVESSENSSPIYCAPCDKPFSSKKYEKHVLTKSHLFNVFLSKNKPLIVDDIQ